MSAYNPPSQNQSIFNPNNYGTAISTLADSAYDEITATLGNFTTLFIGTDNVATTLNTKQDTITGDTQFDSFNVLSNINFLEDGNVGSAYFPLSYTTLTNINTTLDSKQATITNNSLTIARTYGLSNALDTIPLVYFATPSNYASFTVEVATLNQTYFEYTFTGIDLPSFDSNTEKLILDLNGSLKQTWANTPDSTELRVVFDIKSSLDSYSAVLDTRSIYSFPITTTSTSQEYSPIIRIFHYITETTILSTITFRVLASTTSTSTFVGVSGSGNPATLSIYKIEA